MRPAKLSRARIAVAVAFTLAALSCERVDLERMIAQPSYRAYEPAPYFDDGMAMRTPPLGAVPRERVLGPAAFVEGVRTGAARGWVESIPLEVDRELLVRGQGRFRIYCAACHGVAGDGQSQVAENMTLVKPPSLHEARIRAFPPGRLFSVITHGWGLMPSYRDALDERDRWAVVAFVEVLQLSHSVPITEVRDALGSEQFDEEASPWLK